MDFPQLTTTYTPHANCLSSFWYGDSAPTPTLTQGWSDFYASCWPGGTNDARHFAAPATCPVGYWTATTLLDYFDPGPIVPTTVCCYSGYTYVPGRATCSASYITSTVVGTTASRGSPAWGGDITVGPGVKWGHPVEFVDTASFSAWKLGLSGSTATPTTMVTTLDPSRSTGTETSRAAGATPSETAVIPSQNSTTLSLEETVRCLRIVVPIGVFGYYSWLSDLLILIFNTFVMLRLALKGQNKFTILALLHGLCTAAKSVWSLYLTVSAFNRCTGYRNPEDIHGGAGGILAMVLYLRCAGAGMGVITSACIAWGHGFLYGAPAAAALYIYFFGYVFYRPETVFTQIARLENPVGPILAVSIPLLVLFLFLLLAALVCFWTDNGDKAWIFLAIGLVVPFHLWAVGIGHLVLGSFIHDPWGVRILPYWTGKVEAALVGIAPVGSLLSGLPQIY